jgi:hypothetical protein
MFRLAFLLIASTLSIEAARAAVYSVGAGADCAFSSIQEALDVAATHAGGDTIRIANNQAYTAQAIELSTNTQVELVGGFADCSQANSNGDLRRFV